jgi:hypothetical protein
MKTKVICISTGRVPELTLHKIYDGFIFHPLKEDSTIQVVNDKNKVTTYKCERFMTLDEWRELKLNELGI